MPFAAMRMRNGGGAPPPANAFDPAFLSVPAVLSVTNLRLTANLAAVGNYGNSRALKAVTGMCYLSFVVGITSSGAVVSPGLGDATWGGTSAAVYAGSTSTSIGVWGPNGDVYVNGSVVGNVGAIAAGDFVQIAINTSRQVWVRKGGGAYVGGGDPAAGTSPTATLSGSGDIYPIGSVDRLSTTAPRYVQLAPDAASTTGTAPSGFTKANWL